MQKAITLDASQMATFLKCPKMWDLQYIQGLSLTGDTKEALSKGTLVHGVLDIYYTLRTSSPETPYGEHVQLAIETYLKQADIPLDNETKLFVLQRFIAYCENYYVNDFEVAKTKNHLGVELGFSKELGNSANGKYKYVVEGRIDLLINYKGGGNVLAYVDHKTQEQSRNLYSYTPQFLTYAWATGVNWGVINYIGLQKNVSPYTFRRSVILFTDHQINRWIKQMWAIFDEIAGYMDVYEATGKLTPREDLGSCSGAFQSSPCMFTPLCEEEDSDIKNGLIQVKYQRAEKLWRPW